MALVVKNPSANAGEVRPAGSVPGLGRSPGGGNGNPLQYLCLANSMDRGARWAISHLIESLPSGRWGPSSLPPRRPQSNPMTQSLPGWCLREEVAGFSGVGGP